MKKFLSLVLALIMTMSLVTVGASAAEYDDFTDKDEIQYEEAVAVLNRLGIITGYSEGDFRPEGELTRGAAAKIIASLLIGPEAANNLSPTTAPFKDVPLDHTFAGPIAYCSTLKIINGYSDGSFQPGGTLTGYAFSKMLLGALGYDGNEEGFTGAGWSMNVMRLGGEAGLFDRISFKGNEAVNREQAAQLALNTLKGTLVEYTGGMNVVAGDASVTTRATRSYKTSNQEYAAHINNKKAGGQLGTAANALYTVEFGEEHFVDLRMTHDRNTYDDFGRPSNEWSYKKVTIGTFPIEADKVYTEQVAHNVTTVTNASKARALELTGFEVTSSTQVTVNGNTYSGSEVKDLIGGKEFKDVGQIADFTDNGTLVEVYIDEDNADWVKAVVVIKTQLMEVKRLGKDSVSLELYDNGSANKGKTVMGFNQKPIDVKVNNVEIDDAFYTLLSGLKVGDRVAVVPVTTDGGSSYSVAKAYVPETVSGKLNKVSTYGTGSTVGTDVNTIGVTVGDTAYDVALWNKDLTDVDGTKLQVTTKDVTLTLDEFGNALLAEDVGATSDFMVVGSYYQSLVNGKLVNYVKGWDISGEELTLNIGSKTRDTTIEPGDLVHYTNATVGDADWRINATPTEGVFDVRLGKDPEIGDGTTTNYSIKSSNTRILMEQAYKGANKGNTGVTPSTVDDYKPWVDKSIKFIYVTFNDDGDVDSIEIKNGVQAVSYDELSKKWSGAPGISNANYDEAQAALKLKDGAVKDDATVKAVVIKNESNDALASNMLYIVNYKGGAGKTASGDIVYEYTVAMNGASGLIDDEMTIYSTKKLNRGDWARYTEVKNDDYENFYALSAVNQRSRATSTMEAFFDATKADTGFIKGNHSLVYLDGTNLYAPNGSIKLSDSNVDNNLKAPLIKSANINTLGTGDNDAAYLVSLRNAIWVDLTGNGIDSYDDLYDLTHGDTKEYDLKNVKVSMIFNDDPTKDNFRQVAMIVVQSVGAANSGSSSDAAGTKVETSVRLNSRGEPIVEFTVTKPSWVPSDAVGTVTGNLYVDGVASDWTTGTNTIGTVTGSGVVSGRGTDTADSADDVSISDIEVSWNKVVVVPEEGTTMPAGVTVSGSVAVGTGSTINLKVAPTRAAGDITITVNEGDTVLLDPKTLTSEELAQAQTTAGLDITLTGRVTGTAAVTVEVTKEAAVDPDPGTTYTASVEAPSGWTATAIKNSGIAADEDIKITYTKSDPGVFTPKAIVDSSKITNATVKAATPPATNPVVTPGTASEPAKVVLTLTVKGNVTVPANAIDLSAASTPGTPTYAVNFASANWNAAAVANQEAGATVTLNLTAKTPGLTSYTLAAVAAADYTLTTTQTLENVVVTVTKNGTAAVSAQPAKDDAWSDTAVDFTDSSSFSDASAVTVAEWAALKETSVDGKLYTKNGTTYEEYDGTEPTDGSPLDCSSSVEVYIKTQNAAAAVDAKDATAATMTISFKMPAEAVSITAFAYPKA